MGAPVGPGQRVDLVDDRQSAGRRRVALGHPRRQQHHLQGLRRRHQKFGRAPSRTCASRGPACRRARRRTAARPSRCSCRGGPAWLLSSALIGATYSAPTAVGSRRRPAQHGEHRRLGLPARRRCQDDGVLAVEQRLARHLLHRAQAGPPEAGDDRLLQPRRESGEGAHQTSSAGRARSPRWLPRRRGSRAPDFTCSSSSRLRDLKPYSAGLIVRVLLDQIELVDEPPRNWRGPRRHLP